MRHPPTGGRQHPPAAIVAAVMGIVGLVALPLIGPIIALVFGYQSRTIAVREPEVYSDDLGRVGRILGWIGLALAGAFLFLGVLALAAFA